MRSRRRRLRRWALGLAPPAHLLPGVAHGVLKLLPRPLLLRLPPPPGFGLEGRPVAAGIASITGELVAVAIAWGPALIGMTPAGEAGGVVTAEVRVVGVEASCLPGVLRAHRFDLHLR